MTDLWTAHELLEATGGTLSAPFGATGVSIDTRTLRPADLFVALLGEGRDGHAFAADVEFADHPRGHRLQPVVQHE